jgi:RNA polymerase sigma-70 factor (ECF subfamily)
LSYLRHVEDAQEACQDTMLNAMVSLPKFEYRASLKTWVIKIAYHVCADYYRTKRNKDNLFDRYYDAAFLTDEIVLEEDNPELAAMLRTLSSVQREILRYRFVDELLFNEIAIVLGTSLSSVKMNYYRALEKLQKNFIVQAA